MEKQIRFADVEVGTTFRIPGSTIDQTKISAKKARGPEGVEFSILPMTVVTITVPDPVPPTPEEIQAGKERQFLRRLENLSSNAVDLENFITRFREDPTDALSWSSSVIDVAARQTASKWVRAMLEKYSTSEVMQEVLETVLRRARYPEHSTSAMSNLVYEAVTAAYAELVA